MKTALRIACSRQNLQQVRDFVRSTLDSRQLSEITVNQVVLAVDEVVANFIIHANHEDESQFLDLALLLQADRLEIEITDEGSNIFLPAPRTTTPDLRDYIRQGRKGGMGMMLVDRLMDQVEFFTRANHTVCFLSKHLV